ncbi:cupin domain-containing protein [Desulfovibrio sp. JC010]|uniref:cupin domain-containing protein n=1 Tax=Desulfovibrio sp. JC010 TaxID=2593641 RepID=UPI0013CF8BA1|nr:cupin domain-containing protein [Desulfovibrio sp. JC010]NDV26412.1 cupin domain-containing protein [Desulfovibrio sp. JC010]
MTPTEFSTLAANGAIETIDGTINCTDLDWNPHPAFKGVHLKHLVTGETTEGQLSCHIVRIDPGCTLERHIHENQWEMHEIIAGNGEAALAEAKTTYHPGKSAIIPKGEEHSVKAGTEGLTLLAKFFPALI